MATISPTALKQMLDEYPPVREQPHAMDSLGYYVKQLELALGSEPFTLQRLRPRDWEVRTFRGAVGRGVTAADACADLLAAITVAAA